MSARNASHLVMERNANDSIIYLVDVGLVSMHPWRDCLDALCIVVTTKISLDSFVDATNRPRNTRRSRHSAAERPFPIAENDNREWTNARQSDRKSCVPVCLRWNCRSWTTWFTSSFFLSRREGDLRMKKWSETIRTEEEREREKRLEKRIEMGLTVFKLRRAIVITDRSLYNVLKVCSTSCDMDKYRTDDLRCCADSPHACCAILLSENTKEREREMWGEHY